MVETDLKNQINIVAWPSPQEYNESVQDPSANLNDSELAAGLVYLDSLGLPRPVSGSFASVYRLKCHDRDLALRCFLRNVSDQQQRYDQISQFVQHDDLPCTVTFDFLPNGIRAFGKWFPALKMEWVDGDSLDHYIVRNLTAPEKLEQLSSDFLNMMGDLRRAGIAHGDLQHGNIIVLGNGELRLVDYDGMYVPAMQGMKSNENGHRNYQHPRRGPEHFGPGMDNFSAWVIYTSIVALQIDARLWYRLAAGDDCLLFRQSDFLNPANSPAFAALETSSDSRLRSLGRFLRSQLSMPPDEIPYLRSLPTDSGILPDLSPTVLPFRKGPRVLSPSLPEWLLDENIDALLANESKPDAPATIHHFALPKVNWIDPRSQQNLPAYDLSCNSVEAQSLPVSCRLEPELLQPVPRRVEYSPNSLICDIPALQMVNLVFWVVMIFLSQQLAIFSVMLWLLTASAISQIDCKDEELVKTGTARTAEVVDKGDVHVLGGASAEASYYITVSFPTPSSSANPSMDLMKRLEVDAETYRSYEKGDFLTVLYHENSPASSVKLYRRCKFRAII